MNLTNSAVALSVALATGLVFADESTSNGLTPFDDLNTTGSSWFAMPSTGGSWTNNAPIASVEHSGYSEIDSDAQSPAIFGVTQSLGENKICEVTVDMIASPVPASVELAAPASGTKVGFAIKKTTTASEYWAYLGSAWAKLSDDTSVAEGDACTLKIQIDRRDTTKKVRFLVKTTGEFAPIGGWNNLTADIDATPSVDFVGSGDIRNLAGQMYVIDSEKITIRPSGSDVVITVPESIVTALKAKGKDISDFVADTTAGTVTGLNNLERLVLIGKTAEPEAADKPKTVSKAFGATDDNLAIELDNLAGTLPTIGGATPSFVLEGSNNKTDWSPVAESSTGKFEFSATDANKTFKFYRVKASVVYGNAAK